MSDRFGRAKSSGLFKRIVGGSHCPICPFEFCNDGPVVEEDSKTATVIEDNVSPLAHPTPVEESAKRWLKLRDSQPQPPQLTQSKANFK